LELGLNHPRGPLAWGDLLGPASVLAILRGLQGEYGDDRWRPAPRLLEAVRSGERLA
jgi:3-hydroxybutyryl-CoA dehydrogenase